ncbi:ATP-binding protein [Streptomyces sp. DT224]|uniref:ATP-binding protein n=1 Tax=Streptomyces sp. DT224 TaxID=3393426 RepID=UPI003CEBD5E1
MMELVPVLRETRFALPADYSALAVARIDGRTRLTVLGWPGSQHDAVNVLYVLVRNALEHGVTPDTQTFEVRLTVADGDELLVEVDDPNPKFPEFDRAIGGELGRGLWEAQRCGATITYFPADREGGGKTVRATLRPGPVAP